MALEQIMRGTETSGHACTIKKVTAPWQLYMQNIQCKPDAVYCSTVSFLATCALIVSRDTFLTFFIDQKCTANPASVMMR
jgi:hypothetical protein